MYQKERQPRTGYAHDCLASFAPPQTHAYPILGLLRESRTRNQQTEKVCSNVLLFSAVDQLVKLAIPATACNMSASFVGRVPAEIAALIFEYAIEPVGPPVPAAPTEWPRRIGTLADGCTTQFIILSCTALMEY